jgi:hypothetical protein
MNTKKLILTLALTALLSTGCTKKTYIYLDGLHVQGTAKYEKANIENASLTLSNALFGASDITSIKNALVYLVDTTDNDRVIVRGSTDSLGNFKLPLPDSHRNTALAVRVYAISVKSYLDIKVQDRSGNGDPYFVESSSFVGTNKVIEILATRSSGLAGAFNIFTQTHRGIDFVRSRAEPDTEFPDIRIDWKPGGGGPDCSCFFEGYTLIPNRIHIHDYDDFDDSVLLHELGHYMQHVFSKDDSPGGIHNIDCSQSQNLDPRLAWSEGWASGFAMMVLEKGRYIDTDPSGGFFFDIEIPCAINAGPRDEIAVAAMYLDLYDGSNSGMYDADNDSVSLTFAQIWTAMKAINNSNATVYDFYLALIDTGAISIVEWDQAFFEIGLDRSSLEVAN